MKKLLLLLALFASPVFADGLQVDKSPGDPVEIAWNFDTQAESTIDGFVVEKADDIAFTVNTSEVGTVPKVDRKWTLTAPSTPAFYRVKSYKGTTKSTPSNPVAVNIILKAPLGASAK